MTVCLLSTSRDVRARIGKARAVFIMVGNIWTSKEISMKTVLRLFSSNVKAVLLYGCETWRTTQKMLQIFTRFLHMRSSALRQTCTFIILTNCEKIRKWQNWFVVCKNFKNCAENVMPMPIMLLFCLNQFWQKTKRREDH